MEKIEIKLKLLEKQDEYLWDDLIKSSSLGSIFSRLFWLKTSSDSLGLKLILVGGFYNDELVCGCPIFVSEHSGFFKTISNVCGLMPYSGIVIKDYPKENVRKYEKYLNGISVAISKYLLNTGADSTCIVNPPGLNDVRPFIWGGWKVNVLYSYQIDPSNMTFSDNAKREIKKAIKSEVVITESSDIDRYYSLFKLMFHNQGLNPPVPYNYLDVFFKKLTEMRLGDLKVAKTRNDEWVSARINIWDEKVVHTWTEATDPVLRKNGGNHYLLSEGLKAYSKIPGVRINLMRGNTYRLSNFITMYNPELVTYLSLEKKSLKAQIGSTLLRMRKKH